MALALLSSNPTHHLDVFFRDYQQAPFLLRTPEWEWRSSRHHLPVFTLILTNQLILETLLHHPNEVTLGEAFIHGDLKVEGDIYAALRMADYVFHHPLAVSATSLVRVDQALTGMADWLLHGREHSRRRDRSAISFHYDKPPQFFLPWLGPTMVYSCAYFREPDQSIDTAQTNKLDLICRKLNLHPGEQFLDIGCGWGSLLLHAVQHHQVRGRGITLSQEQARFAVQRIEQCGAASSCSVELQDYRDLPSRAARYDKLASVGMVEHVGLENLREYFRIAYKLLKPGGLFLNHGIGRAFHAPAPKESFIHKYVFPNGELVPLHQTIACAEEAGFEVRDVENLREHYARTLRLWVTALQQNAQEILSVVPETTYRIWLLYMAGSAVAFDRGDIFVDQVLLRRVDRTTVAMPATREGWYRDWSAALDQ
jgi:cyclopropane-fatty-acyl-phospholipid synthase